MKIIQEPHPTLRKKSEEVSLEEFGSNKLKKIVLDMQKTLRETKDGVALAAPQINISKRIFVVSERAFEDSSEEAKNLVYINPKITKRSSKKVILDEGCLSVRDVYGKIKRSSNVTIEAFDEAGNKFERGAGGLLAEIFQHETDHLDGILFIDTAWDLEEISPDTDA